MVLITALGQRLLLLTVPFSPRTVHRQSPFCRLAVAPLPMSILGVSAFNDVDNHYVETPIFFHF